MSDEYGNFKPHLEEHRNLADNIQKTLNEENELSTPDLAENVSEESGLSEAYIRSLILEGREYILERTDVVTESRSQGTGGTPTVFWRVDGE